DQTSRCSITITSSTGLLIAMDRGSGARLMGGRGPATNPGAGRLITTVVGSTTTTSGRGVRTARSDDIAVGGVPRWWRSFQSTSISDRNTAGIRCTIISATRAQTISLAN